jgi:hypothetical protein
MRHWALAYQIEIDAMLLLTTGSAQPISFLSGERVKYLALGLSWVRAAREAPLA